MHVFAPEGITGDLTYGFGCTSAHDWGGGLAKSYVARFVGGVAIMDDGTVGGHYDAAGLLPDHDRTVASLAIAALSEGGWKIALRDVARLIGKRCRASLMIADRDAGFFECFEVDTPDRGRKTSFQHRITEKCRDWAFAVQQTPRPQTAILSDCPDEAAALTAVLTKHLTRPASDALVANIDFGGVEGVLCIYNETDCECFMAADQRALARLHHAIEQAALAQSTLSAINIRLAVSDRLLDQLPFGVVTLDLDCRVLSTNATGARLLEEQSVLLVRNERLFCADSLENQSLQAAIADAVRAADTTGQSEHTVIKLYGMDETKPWSLSVSALSGATFEPALAWGRNRPRIVLSISDRDPITTSVPARLPALSACHDRKKSSPHGLPPAIRWPGLPRKQDAASRRSARNCGRFSRKPKPIRSPNWFSSFYVLPLGFRVLQKQPRPRIYSPPSLKVETFSVFEIEALQRL